MSSVYKPGLVRSQLSAPLKGCVITLSTKQVPKSSCIGHITLKQFKDSITKLGGTWCNSADQNSGCTHLVVTTTQYQRERGNVSDAIRNPAVTIVSFDWLKEKLEGRKSNDKPSYILRNCISSHTHGGPNVLLSSNQEPKSGIGANIDAQQPEDTDVHRYAKLICTDVGKNHKKFYNIQLREKEGGQFYCWTQWGRVDQSVQSKLLGDGTFQAAMGHFEGKYQKKTGSRWDDPCTSENPGKYTSYDRSDKETGSVASEIKSRLPGPVQRLMSLMFNQRYFTYTLTALGYDASTRPLKELDDDVVASGYTILQAVAKKLAHPMPRDDRIRDLLKLSGLYSTLIPHQSGQIYIDSMQKIKRETELLESLYYMQHAHRIFRQRIPQMNVLDRLYHGLGMNEMTPLLSNSREYGEVAAYAIGFFYTRYQIEDIFRIRRDCELDRFATSSHDSGRRLLWYGSYCTNFGGILSQGLRVAPQAPVNGYRFGKGIYFADMFEMARHNCYPQKSGDRALLALCEVEIGKHPLRRTVIDYKAGKRARKEGKMSTFREGKVGPRKWKDAGCVHEDLRGILTPDVSMHIEYRKTTTDLDYNEYVVYDTTQVILRYLVRVIIGP